MAGNIRADNNGDIYVEFDYNNIIVVDPNKTIDSLGRIKERLVDHENLVMFANLEAEVLPRTKLAVGASPEDRIRIVSIAKMNFLKPTKDSFLGTGYYDELTGENTTKFKGQNQILSQLNVPKDGTQPYFVEKPADLSNVIDNGLLGITNITIDTNLSFIPTVRISLEDVQGRALFQLGNNSPYAAFFNLPYPPFYLTLKGYYGQAVRYQLNLEKFNARFNTFSGNYQIDLDFRGYKFNILNEIAVGHLIATPHMYSKQFNVVTNPVGPQGSTKAQETNSATQTKLLNTTDDRKTENTVQITSERGYEKIREVYSEYKSKGLIPPDFPELSLMQFITKLDNFEKNVANQFTKVEVEPLTNIRNYKAVLKNYFDQIRSGQNSWFSRYLNPAPIILKDGTNRYVFKNLDRETREDALGQLKSDITNYNKQLAENATLGKNKPAEIKTPITFDTIYQTNAPTYNDIDWVATTRAQTGIAQPTTVEVEKISSQYSVLNVTEVEVKNQNGKQTFELKKIDFFVFEGKNGFDKQIALLESQANKKLSEFEDALTKKLLEKIESGTIGIGFKPTVRNIIAILMASAEAFIRLLDDVHTNSWNLKYDEVRKKAILYNPSSAPGSDTLDDIKLTKEAIERGTNLKYAEIPVYPWPQFFVETPEDKKGRFQLKYLADPTVVELTQGWDYSKWPEVEFVEEYMRGITMKFNPPLEPPPLDTEQDTKLININPIEFPTTGVAYANKEEIKFFYEIWERQFLTARYSNYVRANSNQLDELIKLNTETEVSNIVQSLGLNSPYITMKLKNYGLNTSNYLSFLQDISNQGTGRAWQEYIRDFFVTPYIRNLTENSFGIFSLDEYGKSPQVNSTSTALTKLVTNSTNEPNITDTIPFTDPTWVTNNMAAGNGAQSNSVYNTNKVLTIFDARKIISNFSNIYDVTTKRPVTNFSYITSSNPYPIAQQNGGLNIFYSTRTPDQFVVTEGYYRHIPPGFRANSNGLTQLLTQFPVLTTTSMLNTPYMVNAIQNGVQNDRDGVTYPYVQAAYLLINSLPLASLKEKYKTFNNNTTTDLDYIASCFKKFGAIHKLPYSWIVKMGSIWHRYKVFKQTGTDILETAWKNFDYTTNFSPKLSSVTQTYNFKYNSVQREITLQKEDTSTIKINNGFYPKVINDFFKFCTGYEVYVNYTDSEIQNTINGGMKIYNFGNSNIETSENQKTLTVTTQSVLIPGIVTSDKKCDTNNTVSGEYYIVPSFGSAINQTKIECVTNTTAGSSSTITNLASNSSMYNGSVRLFWAAPNYGYFDNSQVVLPNPDEYPNKINPNLNDQSPFYLLNENGYSKIEEVFSVFDKRILDLFEQEFLNFSKPLSGFETLQNVDEIGTSSVTLNANFRNFQSLFKSLLTVTPSATNNENEYFQNVINVQYNNVQNTLRAFLEYDVLFKYGNPSNYKRRILDSYLSHNSVPTITDPITFNPYVTGSLPTRNNNLLLSQSIAQNPQAWRTLELEVGFSTIPNVNYSFSGSYITDFFVDNNIEFTADNVQLLNQIIKMYATFKLKNPNSSVTEFKTQIQNYLNNQDLLQGNFLNGVLRGLNKNLPNQYQIPQGRVNSVITGEQSKIESYEIFKALNDKWIAGGDFKTKTLFEDILFLDRASRNIGQTVLIDIFDIRSMLNANSLNNAMSVFNLISSILIKNNFTVMNLPAYVNFYNVQNVDGTTIPQPEGSLDFANNLWGTFLNVDYRESSPKMVCFYVGKPSQYLDLPKGNFRFRDDAFEMRRASENPLIENLNGKKDWAVSNKCVGFNVDIGTRNQNVFYSFQIEQSPGNATSESINTMLNMVDQATGRNVATQNVSLYNLYKQRSYKCSAVCLGNALIQPSMYFNLRHVPMFNGPYMIQSVQHSVQPGNFQTTFTGVRQGIYDLPSIDSFLQSMNQNLLTRLEEVLNIKKDTPQPIATTEDQKTVQTVQKSNSTLDAQNSCTSKVDVTIYRDYEVLPNRETRISPREFVEVLKTRLPGDSNENLRLYIYLISYVNSFVESSNTGAGSFVGYNNNFALISLNKNFGDTSNFFQKRYCCVNVTTDGSSLSLPIVSFSNVSDYVDFMAARLRNNQARIEQLTPVKYYACYFPTNNVSESYFDANINKYETLIVTFNKAYRSATDVKLVSSDKSLEVQQKNREQLNNQRTPGVTPTPSPIPPNPGQTCPPPTISTFAPVLGNTGTIIQITGRNLESTTGVTINNTRVKKEDIRIINGQTLRVSVPQVGTGTELVVGNIKVETFYGDFTSILQFKYDPTLAPSASSSPGSYINNASGTEAIQTTVGTNSQNTDPNPLVVETSTTNTLLGDQILTVKVNSLQNKDTWKIDDQPKYNFKVNKIEEGPNNTKIVSVSDQGVGRSLVGYVSPDKQTFSITRDDVVNEIFDDYISMANGNEVKIKMNIELYVRPDDRQLNPKDSLLTYNFDVTVPRTVGGEKPTATIVFKGNFVGTELPSYNGPQYYNIKTPNGVNLLYQFDCSTCQIVSVKLLNIVTNQFQQPVIINSPDTKYMNVINLNTIGNYRLVIEYKNPNGQQIFTAQSSDIILT